LFARRNDQPLHRDVLRAGAADEVTDGPYIETKEWLVGFFLLSPLRADLCRLAIGLARFA
jgi:hypothetical protein